MSRPPPVIAIDGPAAAGKGSVARGVAAALGFHYLDSGKIYRAVAVAARDGGLLPATAGDTALAALARRLANNPAALARLLAQPRLLADEAAKDASALAARPRLRRALVAAQRAARRPPGLVADGRDMGATIFPDAAVKIFLTASARERARRRALQLRQNGMRAIIKDVLADLRRRDARDAGRNASPLRAAPTALRLSSTRATVDDLVLRIVAAFDKAVFVLPTRPRGGNIANDNPPRHPRSVAHCRFRLFLPLRHLCRLVCRVRQKARPARRRRHSRSGFGN